MYLHYPKCFPIMVKSRESVILFKVKVRFVLPPEATTIYSNIPDDKSDNGGHDMCPNIT